MSTKSSPLAVATNADYKPPYVIRVRRTFYGASDRHSLLATDGPDADLFGSPAEARAEIRRLDGQVHHQMHNEYGRPEYSVVRVDRLPAYLEACL